VTFNDHEGSTKSYAYVREHTESPVSADYIAPREEIRVQYAPGESISVPMHDGSSVLLRKLDPDYDPTDRVRAAAYVQERAQKNEYVTGLIHVDTSRRDFHEQHGTTQSALNAVPFERLCPGAAKLDKIPASFRGRISFPPWQGRSRANPKFGRVCQRGTRHPGATDDSRGR
jgi:2-oxoglutarate ferredoxin oxidoreductase subunit beta